MEEFVLFEFNKNSPRVWGKYPGILKKINSIAKLIREEIIIEMNMTSLYKDNGYEKDNFSTPLTIENAVFSILMSHFSFHLEYIERGRNPITFNFRLNEFIEKYPILMIEFETIETIRYGCVYDSYNANLLNQQIINKQFHLAIKKFLIKQLQSESGQRFLYKDFIYN